MESKTYQGLYQNKQFLTYAGLCLENIACLETAADYV